MNEDERAFWIRQWIHRMLKKHGRTVYEKGGKAWDWEQALIREQYGKDYNIFVPDYPTDGDIARAKKWEDGDIPEWVCKPEFCEVCYARLETDEKGKIASILCCIDLRTYYQFVICHDMRYDGGDGIFIEKNLWCKSKKKWKSLDECLQCEIRIPGVLLPEEFKKFRESCKRVGQLQFYDNMINFIKKYTNILEKVLTS